MLENTQITRIAIIALWLGLFGLNRPAGAADPALSSVAPATTPAGPPAYKDPSLPFDKRVADLIGRMTLEEKLSQLELASAPIPRFGMPNFDWWNEGIHGVSRAGTATVFPECIAMAAAWDPDLTFRLGVAISDEARAKYYQQSQPPRYHGLTYWCPTINMSRDPRWGRIEECFGEDPYLTTRLCVPYIKGLQGDDPKYLKIAATPKHFAAYSQETRRASANATVTQRVLQDYYLPAFRASIVEGKAASIMAAFPAINKVPNVANKWLLTDLLRGQWGFDGVVVTDWTLARSLMVGHRFVDSEDKAVGAMFSAGVDIICEPKSFATPILSAYKQGLFNDESLNRALTSALTVRFRLGMFDPPDVGPYSRAHFPASMIGSPEHPEHIQLALETSRASIVLLKNEPIARGNGGKPLLPLDRTTLESIAVLGPYANECQFGAYPADHPAGKPIAPLEGLLTHVGSRITVRHVPFGNNDAALKAAVKAATECDVAVIVAGLNRQIEAEGHDRITLDLPIEQMKLVEAVMAVNPMTVVVLEGGGPVAATWITEHVPAVVEIWYAGEQGGNALADVLLGDYNPSGRLPQTFYKSLDDVPPLEDYEISAGKGRTYMYAKAPPLWAFGHGLSYTTFTYSQLSVAPGAAPASGVVKVSCQVANTGGRDGDEIVQLYIHNSASAVYQPIKQLAGFTKIHLKAGESRRVTIDLPVKELAYWDEKAGKPVIDAGKYEIMLGAASDDIRLNGELTVHP